MNTDTPTTALPPVAPCEFCGARIRWVQTAATGANMPVDADKDPEKGNQLWLPGERRMAQLPASLAAQRRAEGMPLYLYHGVKCVRTRRMASQVTRPPVERRDPPASATTRSAALEVARQALGEKPRRKKARR